MSRVARREKLRALMQRRGLGVLLLRRPADFAWYTGGADNTQAPRKRGEQTPGMEIAEHAWHTGLGAVLKELGDGSVLPQGPENLPPA